MKNNIAIIHRFHKEPSYYAEYDEYSAGNFSDLTLYEIISFMSAVLGTTADCIFSKVKILFLNSLKKLHDFIQIMQDAMLHILSDALRLLKYARRSSFINFFKLFNSGGQLLKSEVE